MGKLPIALQLYTVRDDAGKDFVGTIKKIAEIGYTGVELAGHGGISVRELKSLLDDNGLKIAGSHIGIDMLENGISKVIDENLALGNPNIVVPYLSDDRRKDSAGYKKVAAALNGFGETLRAHGLTLAYHNHAFEFEKLDNGQTGMEILLSETDGALVKAEVDTYWVLVGGLDPVAFVKKYPSRVVLMHLKDRDKEDGSFAELGTGNLPLDALVEAASSTATSWLIVEQDVCKRPPMEAISISFSHLKTKGYA